jgi:hypothetical protein
MFPLGPGGGGHLLHQLIVILAEHDWNHQFEANLILRTDLNFIGEFLGTPNLTQKDLAPEDAIGKSFLMPPEDDRTCHRACIIEIINE